MIRTVNNSPNDITDKVHTHSLYGFSSYIKQYLLGNYEYNCTKKFFTFAEIRAYVYSYLFV